ncbi:MAG: T9SS type A sorting domain-containing protein [Agriterribacter sp.]
MNHFVRTITTGVMAAFMFISAPAMPAKAFNETPVGKSQVTEETKSFDIKIVQRRNTESIVLYILKQGGKKLSVELYSPNGALIEKHVAGKKETNLTRFYNFANADEGIYVFKISDGDKEIIRKVTLSRFTTAATTQIILP